MDIDEGGGGGDDDGGEEARAVFENPLSEGIRDVEGNDAAPMDVELVVKN